MNNPSPKNSDSSLASSSLDITPSVSTDNPNRVELLWNPTIEKVISSWMTTAMMKAADHEIKAVLYKRRHHVWGLSSVIFAIFCGAFTQIEDFPATAIVGLMALSATLTSISNFFNFQGQRMEHSMFEQKYRKYANRAYTLLHKPKAHRPAADICLSEFRLEIDALNEHAPDL